MYCTLHEYALGDRTGGGGGGRAYADADALHSQCVGAFAFPKKVAKAPRRNALTPCLSDSRRRTPNGEYFQVPCTPHFWSDVHTSKPLRRYASPRLRNYLQSRQSMR